MYCKHCGKLISDQATMCPYCSKDVQPITEDKLVFCRYCGAKISEKATVCPQCGKRILNEGHVHNGVIDAPSFGWGALGFFFPIIGLVLYLVWREQTPLRAKSCGVGALISVIVEAVVCIVYFGIMVGLISVFLSTPPVA